MTKRKITKQQESRIRTGLMAERYRLGPNLPNTRDVIAVSPGVAIEDQAALLHDQTVALYSHGLDRHKLRMIDLALDRMERGEFGICQECEEPIAIARLQAVPWTPLCVACQHRLEVEGADADLELSYA